MADTGDVGTTVVGSVPIIHRSWGPVGRPGVVLVHGGLAHSRWWDHIAPLLTIGGRRVVAVDLSGHGDSGRQPRYDFDIWANEVIEVAEHAGFHGRPIVVGHSMGGLITLRLAMHSADRIDGAIAVDSPLIERTSEDRTENQRRAFAPQRAYPTRQEMLARFRPVPDQATLPYVRAHIAATSIRRCAEGWTWKYDPRVFGGQDFDTTTLARLRGRVCILRAEHGMSTDDPDALLRDKSNVSTVEIPAAGHHVMIDQPLALVAALRVLLETWQPVQGT